MNTCSGPERLRVQLTDPMLVTETPTISWSPMAEVGAPVLARSCNAASEHSSRPRASVLAGSDAARLGTRGLGAVVAAVGGVLEVLVAVTPVVVPAVLFPGGGVSGGVLPGEVDPGPAVAAVEPARAGSVAPDVVVLAGGPVRGELVTGELATVELPTAEPLTAVA